MSEASTCAECGRTSDEWVAYSHELGAEVCWNCNQNAIANAQAEAHTAGHEHLSTSGADDPATEDIRIVGAAEFAAVDEPGAEPLVGDGEVLIPEGAT